MAKQDFDRIIRDFFKYHNKNVNDLKYLFNGVVPVVRLSSEKTLHGLRNIIQEVSDSSDGEQTAILDEWAEYMQVHRNHFNSSNILKELNKYLLDKVYFLGNQIGPIDILMYYLLYSIFVSMVIFKGLLFYFAMQWYPY